MITVFMVALGNIGIWPAKFILGNASIVPTYPPSIIFTANQTGAANSAFAAAVYGYRNAKLTRIIHRRGRGERREELSWEFIGDLRISKIHYVSIARPEKLTQVLISADFAISAVKSREGGPRTGRLAGEQSVFVFKPALQSAGAFGIVAPWAEVVQLAKYLLAPKAVAARE